MVAALVAVAVLLAVVGGSVVLVRFLRRQHVAPAGASGRIDPFTIGEPWRHHVAGAQAAQRRYRSQVQTLADGPTKARMAEIGIQVDRAVVECWDIARRGHQLDSTIRSLDPGSLRARLDRSTDDRERTSLRAQLASVDRIRVTRDDADAQLRGLQTRLGELVAQAAEVVAGAGTMELGTGVDDVVTQLEALRLALREVDEPLIGLDRDTDTG